MEYWFKMSQHNMLLLLVIMVCVFKPLKRHKVSNFLFFERLQERNLKNQNQDYLRPLKTTN